MSLVSQEIETIQSAQKKLSELTKVWMTLDDPNFGIPVSITPTQEQLDAAETALQNKRTQILGELQTLLAQVLGS